MSDERLPTNGTHLDPRLYQVLRVALADLTREAMSKNETVKRAVPHAPSFWRSDSFWVMAASLMVVVSSVCGLYAFYELSRQLQLTEDDVAMLRERHAESLRKEDFNSRNLAVSTISRELPTTSDAALVVSKERADAREKRLKAARNDISSKLEELKNDVEAVRERIEKAEKKTNRADKSSGK